MIKTLRHKFVMLTMSLLALLLAGVLAIVYMGNASAQTSLTTETLKNALYGYESVEYSITGDLLAPESTITLKDPTGILDSGSALTYVAEISYDGTITSDSGNVLELPDDVLYQIIVDALQSGELSGENSKWSVAWMIDVGTENLRIAMTGTYSRNQTLHRMLLTAVAVFVLTIGILFAVVWFLSGWILHPVEENWLAQHRFVSDASHELKTPLAVILANTQILEENIALDDENLRWVINTKEEAEHLKELTDDLLTLAQADEQTANQKASVKDQSINFSSLTDGCVLEFDVMAYEKNLTLSCDIEPSVYIKGNKVQLTRMVKILLDNAIKYANGQTTVYVSVKKEQKQAVLSVTNHGDVIDPKDLDHLFDRFYRSDTARERQTQGGFGLGLAIAKSIVELHKGTITCSSDAASGTCFTVRLKTYQS